MAGKSDGTVYVNTLIDTKGFGKGVNTMQKQIGGLSGAIGKLGTVIATTFAVGKLAQWGKEAIDLGSDLQEVQNVVDVTFSTMNEAVNEFAQNAAETAGLSETMAKRYTGTFGAMAKAFGFAESEAFDMSTSLTQLAGDVASFYNLTQDEAYTKLKSVFTGETESLKDLGVVMTQSALDSFAMAEGYGKTTKQMTEQEKVALRYAFVLEQLSSASGDFVRTSDSWANMMRVLTLSFDTFKANIGQALINIFTPFLRVINQIVDKMAQLSQHFVAFSEMLVGRSTSGGGGSPGAVLEETASGYDDVADSTKEAAKAQNKYLTGLDEIRTFQKPQGAESGGSGGGIGAISSAETEKGNEEVTETNSLMDKLVEKVNQLKDLFSQGFSDGLGDTTERVNSLKDSFETIKQSLSSIFDTDFTQGLDGYIQSITQSFGELTGSFASIGLTIGTNLLGGISGYLDSEGPNIKQYFLDMLDIVSGLSEKCAELSSAFAYIFEPFSNEDGQQITEDLIAIFVNPIMTITELLGQFALDIVTFFVDPFVSSKDELKTGFEDLLAGISEFTGSVRQIFDEFFQLVSQFYNEHIAPIFQRLMPDMEALWQEHISPLLSRIGAFFSTIGDNLSVLWNDLIKPFIQWFSANVMPVISPILEAVGRTFIRIFGTIADVIGGFLDIIGGLITFIVGVFTGDWNRAWDGIKDIFSGIWSACESIITTFSESVMEIFNALKNALSTIWNSIKNTVLNVWNSIVISIKNAINGIIYVINSMIGGIVNGINSLIGALNGLRFSIPDWVPVLGGNSFGLNIGYVSAPYIPYLATGAVIPPNAPFMAVLGDQKHGTNIEAPLSTIESALDNVLNRRGEQSGNMTIHNVMQVNRRTLYDEFIEEAKLRMSTTGRSPFDFA